MEKNRTGTVIDDPIFSNKCIKVDRLAHRSLLRATNGRIKGIRGRHVEETDHITPVLLRELVLPNKHIIRMAGLYSFPVK